MQRLAPVAALVVLAGCASTRPTPPPGAEAVAADGSPLFAPTLTPARRAELERELEEARARHDATTVDGAVWIGRRVAYLGRFREAIAIFTDGIARHPREPRLLRHRGHRYVTVREFDLAEADLGRAAALIEGTPDEVEPDGRANARGVPIGSLHSNVWYHLGLARYLRRDWRGAVDAYRRGEASASNADRLCSNAYWLHLSLRRLGRREEADAALARIDESTVVIENEGYRRLALMFRGRPTPDALLADARAAAGDANGYTTTAYGVGMHRLLAGDRAGAEALFREIVAHGNWPAFGHIAAEVELRALEGP